MKANITVGGSGLSNSHGTNSCVRFSLQVRSTLIRFICSAYLKVATAVSGWVPSMPIIWQVQDRWQVEPLKNAPAENLRNTAFSLRTGDQDFGFYREQLTRYTKRALDSLQRLHPDGYTHQVELIPGYGHAIDYDPTTPWLRQHTRNPYPKHVTWENFEMDGLYRDGFYNLYVDQRSNSDTSTRTLYEMDINGNDINLCVSLVEYTTTETDPRWGIALDFAKYYTRAATGVVTVYLNNQLVDLAKPVTLTVNGNVAYHGLLTPTLENMVNSCARFFDPARIYPAAITVDLSRL